MFKIKSILVVILLFIGFRFLRPDVVSQISSNGKIVYIFAHGWSRTSKYVEFYRDCGVIPKSCTLFAPNGPEVDVNGVSNKWKSVLAQEADIAVIVDSIKHACNEYGDNCEIVGVGVSKGAATWINVIDWLAKNKSLYLKNIKAVVLEAPFADVSDVIYETQSPRLMRAFLGKPISKKIIQLAMYYLFPNYDPYGITPIESVKTGWAGINKNMIVVWVHSKEDAFINVRHSKIMRDELKKIGLNNFYFLQLKHGRHANAFWDASKTYALKFVWSVYRKHNLPLPASETEIEADPLIKSILVDVNKMSEVDLAKFVESFKVVSQMDSVKV